MKKKLTFLDVVLVLCVLALTLWSGFLIYGHQSARVFVRIEGPEGSWLYPLDQDRFVEIKGPLGYTKIQIKDGSAQIIASPCPNQTCISGSHILHAGDWNACLPNRVIIRGETSKSEETEIDIVAQ